MLAWWQPLKPPVAGQFCGEQVVRNLFWDLPTLNVPQVKGVVTHAIGKLTTQVFTLLTKEAHQVEGFGAARTLS